jgi:hypothetical protein
LILLQDVEGCLIWQCGNVHQKCVEARCPPQGLGKIIWDAVEAFIRKNTAPIKQKAIPEHRRHGHTSLNPLLVLLLVFD